jgi:hypothetical protein
VAEVPSFEAPRLHGVSNLNAMRDGFRILGWIGREWYHTRWEQRSRRGDRSARVLDLRNRSL